MSHFAESLFEQYLSSQGMQWEYENHPGIKQPDYAIQHASGKCIFEVKEITDPDPRPKTSFFPIKPVRAKINAAGRQFREYKRYSCNLVLFTKSMWGPHDPDIMISAAFGPAYQRAGTDGGIMDANAPAYRFPRKSELPEEFKDLPGPSLSLMQNTTFSSLILLAKYQLDDLQVETWHRLYARWQAGEPFDPHEQFQIYAQLSESRPRTTQFQGTLRVIVIENRHARIPLPADLFRGPFDQRWGWKDDWCTPVWLGETSQSLYASGVPFHLL